MLENKLQLHVHINHFYFNSFIVVRMWNYAWRNKAQYNYNIIIGELFLLYIVGSWCGIASNLLNLGDYLFVQIEVHF